MFRPKSKTRRVSVLLLLAFCSGMGLAFTGSKTVAQDVVAAAPVKRPGAAIRHDAEYYLLAEQNGRRWAAEDADVGARLAALRAKYGRPPNIVFIMWDDMSLGEVGVPVINKVRGYDTPNLNRMAAEGMSFARMYTESSCTPTRAAAMTGRLAARNGMFKVTFPVDGIGLNGDEVTIAEALSEAGYATGFIGKWHLGDIEESYPHNQGFDTAAFSPYNQFPGMNWHAEGTQGGYTNAYTRETWDKNYALDKGFRPFGYVMFAEGAKGGQARDWGEATHEKYRKQIQYEQKWALDYIRKNAKGEKPFFLTYWPSVYDLVQQGRKVTTSNGSAFAENIVRLDRYVGQILDEIRKQGIAENTLVIAMADNGPFKELGVAGPAELLLRGGKGGYLEGSLRVPAFAWWPGTIAPNQVVGDIVHVTDLFTTFARLGGALDAVPTDRVIDGLDQTALLLNGDTHSRRDYVFVYVGPVLAATVKQQIKRHWIGDRPGLVSADFFNIYQDVRENQGMMFELIWAWASFDQMRARHENLIKKYPNRPVTHGVPFEGIENLREETRQLQKRFLTSQAPR